MPGDDSNNSQSSQSSEQSAHDGKRKLPDRIGEWAGSWTKVLYALTGMAVAGVAFWTVVWPHLPHHHQLEITATCSLGHGRIVPGITTMLTYTIGSNQAATVGLGAGIYNNLGNDESTGYGDVASFPLKAGNNTYSRPVYIPSSLGSGRYEVDGEIWPANEVGAPGANTYAGPTCAWFSVP